MKRFALKRSRQPPKKRRRWESLRALSKAEEKAARMDKRRIKLEMVNGDGKRFTNWKEKRSEMVGFLSSFMYRDANSVGTNGIGASFRPFGLRRIGRRQKRIMVRNLTL